MIAMPLLTKPIVSRVETVYESRQKQVTGFNTFRIPAIVATKNHTILAFAEGRAAVTDQSENVIVLRTKKLGGTEWSPIQIVASDGNNALNNPCALVDHSGTVWLMYQEYPHGYSEGSVTTGYSPLTSCQAFVIHSTDNGKTWSKPDSITKIVRPKQEKSVASGPGNGIELQHGLHRGRMVFPLNWGANGRYWNTVVFSDDHGRHWRRGQDVPEPKTVNGNECQIAEGENGTILMNSRNQGPDHYRVVSQSTDGGETWSELTVDRNLIDPVCTGSILRVSFRPNLLVFCNPASQTHRVNGTLRFSSDNGQTWVDPIVITPDSFQYCSMCNLGPGKIGILYETADNGPRGGELYTIKFVTVDLSPRH